MEEYGAIHAARLSRQNRAARYEREVCVMRKNLRVMPKLSVIVLVYNVEPYIERCLNSILAQDFEDFEILLVTELRSTDRSVEICQRFAAGDSRVKILLEDGNGFPAARNRGLDNACGEYVTFIDADDYILPEMFSVMYKESNKQNLNMLCCGGKKDLGGQQIAEMSDYVSFKDALFVVTPKNQRDYMYKLAVNGRTITVWAKFYNQKFLKRNHLRFHSEAYSEDFVFNFACYTSAKRVGTMEQAFYIYYDRRDSRIYSSDIVDIERSVEILWGLYQGYSGSAPEDVRAYAAVRIVSSTLFNLKLKPLPVKKICEIAWGIIQKIKIEPYLLRASDKNRFSKYANAVAMSHETAENYWLFIRSLQSCDAMYAWQKRYAEAEKRTIG
jgi:glycosyltransferase EpsJ